MRRLPSTEVAQFVSTQKVDFPPPVWLWALAERETAQVAKTFGIEPSELRRPYKAKAAKKVLARLLDKAYPHSSVVARALRVSVNTYLYWLRVANGHARKVQEDRLASLTW